MRFQLFCIDKRKDSTSDLDQEREFQKKMMNVSSGSRGMQRFSVNDWVLGIYEHFHAHTHTNTQTMVTTAAPDTPQSHF